MMGFRGSTPFNPKPSSHNDDVEVSPGSKVARRIEGGDIRVDCLEISVEV